MTGNSELPRTSGTGLIAVAAGVLAVAGCEQPTLPPFGPEVGGGELAAFSASTDSAALMELYESTDGENWKNNTNWGTDEDLEDWYGVSANGAGRVNALVLRDNDLSGDIVADLGDLTEIEWLLLDDNDDLLGDLPAELGDLTKLRWLSLANTSVSGEIPAELETTAMVVLVFIGTDVTGGIPPELGNLEDLRALDLRHNKRMSGTIPPELGRLASLEILYLIDTGLSGEMPSTLGALPKLKWADFRNNDLSVEIPSGLGALPKLETLFLSGNDLSGEVPRSLGGLTTLRRLDLQGNKLTGEIPNTWLALDLEDRGFTVWDNQGLCIPRTKAFDIWLQDIKFPLWLARC